MKKYSNKNNTTIKPSFFHNNGPQAQNNFRVSHYLLDTNTPKGMKLDELMASSKQYGKEEKKVRQWWISGFYLIGIWHMQSLFFIFYFLLQLANLHDMIIINPKKKKIVSKRNYLDWSPNRFIEFFDAITIFYKMIFVGKMIFTFNLLAIK